MTYATASDLVDAFGADEVGMIADRDHNGAADPAVLARALEDADAEINSYLSGRYQLPLDPVPAQIRAIACDIARYRLDAVNPREVTRDRYRMALAALRDIQAGRAQLGAAGAAAGSAQPPANSGAMFEADPATFSDAALRGF